MEKGKRKHERNSAAPTEVLFKNCGVYKKAEGGRSNVRQENNEGKTAE